MAYGDGPADQQLHDAWHAFCENLKAAGDKAFKEANPPSPLHRADAFRFLTQNLGQAFPLALETADPAALRALRERLAANGIPVAETAEGLSLADPWRNAITLRQG